MTEQCFFDLLKQIRDYAEECNDFAHDFARGTDSVASELLPLFLPENRIFAYFHAVSGGNGVITGL